MAFLPFSLSFLLSFHLCFTHYPLPIPSPSPSSVSSSLCCLLLSSRFPRLSFLTLSVHRSLFAVRSFSFFLSSFFTLFSSSSSPEDKRVALCRTICIFQSLHPPYHSFPYKYPVQILYTFPQDRHLGMKESRITGFLWKVRHICGACSRWYIA